MRLTRIFATALFCTTALYPAEAHAALIAGFLAGALFSTTGIVTGGLAFAGASAGLAFGTFLTSGFGSLLISVAATAAQFLLADRPRAPSVESARVNVRIGEPQRWIHLGRSRVGGGAMFGEYDDQGAFWFIIVHGDSPLRVPEDPEDPRAPVYLLDEIPVELDEDGWVITAEFTKSFKEGEDPVFRIWTRTFTPDNPIPPPVTEFKAAFPEWTDDHLLVGTTYSVIRCRGLNLEDTYKVMTWRGPFGLGEPGLSIIGDWDYIYDPRDEAQDINDMMTWGCAGNPELVWARFRTHPWGRNKPMSSINWQKAAENADICDQPVTDKNGNVAPRYVCGISVPDEKERHVGESEILLSADAMIMHDAEGKAYAQVGHWYEPTLTLSRKRDIMAMASREAADGESETDGVIVKYVEPDFLYVGQPAAAWINPNYYDPARTPRFLTIEVLACQNHNQAVRLAKAMGLRTQSKYRLAPTVGLRGLLAEEERIIDLQYDAVFSGAHEIAAPVDEDEDGVSCNLGLVPIDANRWTLLPGEEGDKPAPVVDIDPDPDLPLPTGVSITAEPVPGSNGNSVRLEAVFDAPPRPDWRYEFQYKKAADTAYKPMLVLMNDLIAYSDTISDNTAYHVQYRTVTLRGRASDWKTPPVTVNAVADPVAPLAVTPAVTPGMGNAMVAIATGSDLHVRTVKIFRLASGAPAPAPGDTATATIAVGPSSTFFYIDGDGTTANMLANGDLSAAGPPPTLGANWSIGSGVATKSAGGGNSISWAGLAFVDGANYRYKLDIPTLSGGSLTPRLTGGTTVTGTAYTTTGTKYGTLAALTGNTTFGLLGATAAAGTIDNLVLFAETPTSVAHGTYDYYAIPFNGSGINGPVSGPVTVTII